MSISTSIAIPIGHCRSVIFHCLGSRAESETRLSQVTHVILSSVHCLVKVLRVHNVFLVQLRLTAIVPLQQRRQTIDAKMAAPLWADDVSSVNTHNYYQMLTYRKQGDISNDSLHHETAEALKLRSPYTPMNPAWLFEGTFEDWLSKTYPDLELSKKVRPVRTLSHNFPFETAN